MELCGAYIDRVDPSIEDNCQNVQRIFDCIAFLSDHDLFYKKYIPLWNRDLEGFDYLNEHKHSIMVKKSKLEELQNIINYTINMQKEYDIFTINKLCEAVHNAGISHILLYWNIIA